MRNGSELLKQMFENQREETNRRFDELGKLMCSRFDKLENTLTAHIRDDAAAFETLRADIAQQKVEKATKRRMWGVTATIVGLVIAGLGVAVKVLAG